MIHSVVARYLLSRESSGSVFKHVIELVKKDDFDGALEILDEYLNKTLNVRVFPHRDEITVKTEWVHGLWPEDQTKFEDLIRNIAGIRGKLLWKPEDPEHLREEKYRLVDWLEGVTHDLPWLEEILRGTDEVIKHGPWTLILGKVPRDRLGEALDALDKASELVHAKFPKVLYGKVYVVDSLRPKGTYDPAPQSGGKVAGSYVAAGDFIHLSLYATPDRNSVMTLIHELGHRYHSRFLNGDQRDKFKELSTVGDVKFTHYPLAERRKIADELLALFTEHRNERYPESDTFLSERARLWLHNYPRDEYKKDVVPWLKKFRDEKEDSPEVTEKLLYGLGMFKYEGNLRLEIDVEQRHPVYASMYGMTDWMENFAETFLAYVTHKALPPELHAFMDGL